MAACHCPPLTCALALEAPPHTHPPRTPAALITLSLLACRAASCPLATTSTASLAIMITSIFISIFVLVLVSFPFVILVAIQLAGEVSGRRHHT